MTIHGESMFIFDFNSTEDRTRALEMGSMFISNRLFIVKHWSRVVEKEIAELKSIPVWMNFRNVPLFMWNNKGLSMIASYHGNPLMMDTQTLNKTRMSYARICVEVDVNCEFLDSFTFTLGGKDTIEIKTNYSWKPPKCKECAVFGHVTTNCPKNVKPVQNVVQKWVQKHTVNTAIEDGWTLKSRLGAKTNKQIASGQSNVVPQEASEASNVHSQEVSEAVAMESDQEHTHVLQENKENFQEVLHVTQQKNCAPESSNSGYISHFDKICILSPPTINLFPKIADLKKSARGTISLPLNLK
ncbi:uncharacterized protein LOC113352872 [Papaver somniferum]|uniref:uncharacterized protein LOC113352872 n=1 Tax=Papaver somniferum TaxID=3469 RepID=UPI000E7038EE|nr:uncharacterized protein LOC113352872 [Papaver somniferum]